jgi:hypothetical protein
MPSITGIPGMGDEIDGAMQQAPQSGRQFTAGASGFWRTGREKAWRIQA